MNDKDYRQAVRRAILQAIPLETLELFREACKAIEAMGQKPEAVFRRIIDRAEAHKMTELMTPDERRARIAELLRLAEQRRAAAQGKADDHE